MDLALANRKAIISGANRGIGRCIALAYAAEGVHLALLGRNREACNLLAQEIATAHPDIRCTAVYVDLEHPQTAATIGDHFMAKDLWETPDTIQTLLRYPDKEVQIYFEGTFVNARNAAMLEFMGSDATLYLDRGRYEVHPERKSKTPASELILGEGPRGADFYAEPDGETLHRHLLWTLYLNHGFDGGETEFLFQQRKVAPRTGDLLLAPTAFTHTHRGNRPNGGDKFIATSWILFQRAEALYGGG